MSSRKPVLVVDFGAQYAQLIARRVREAHPAAIVLSGGPSSVYEPGAPQVDPALFAAGVPVFGICYGFQAMARALGGEVAHTGQREFGATELTVFAPCTLLEEGRRTVWMSHGDGVTVAPPGFTVTARSERAPVAAFEDLPNRRAGVQFHPEVVHTASGPRRRSSRSRSPRSAPRSATRRSSAACPAAWTPRSRPRSSTRRWAIS